MPTIKGPMKFSKFNAGEFLKEHSKDFKIKLPFEATGFKSSKTPKHADMSKIKLAVKEKPKAPLKKVVKKVVKK